VLSQLVSGSILSDASYGQIYLISGVFPLLVAFVLYFFVRGFKDPVYRKMALMKTCRTFLRNKNLSKAYIINLILKFFYAWMIIYTPIYLHQILGFEWDKIGIIFSIMLLPFVLVTFPLGKLSDKIGEKKMLKLGFIIATSTVFIIPFIRENSILIWAIVLFATRVGAATIEIMSESHFFKIVKEEDVDEISFFRNTGPMSFIIAPLLAIPVLLFTPSFEYIFFVLSAILLCGLFVTLRLKDVK
jgi:MFS family permease